MTRISLSAALLGISLFPASLAVAQETPAAPAKEQVVEDLYRRKRPTSGSLGGAVCTTLRLCCSKTERVRFLIESSFKPSKRTSACHED